MKLPRCYYCILQREYSIYKRAECDAIFFFIIGPFTAGSGALFARGSEYTEEKAEVKDAVLVKFE